MSKIQSKNNKSIQHRNHPYSRSIKSLIKINGFKNINFRNFTKILPLNQSVNPSESMYEKHPNKFPSPRKYVSPEECAEELGNTNWDVLQTRIKTLKEQFKIPQDKYKLGQHIAIQTFIRNHKGILKENITILGRMTDSIAYYADENPYNILSLADKDWNEDINALFIICALKKGPIFVLVPHNINGLIRNISLSITALELNLISKYILSLPNIRNYKFYINDIEDKDSEDNKLDYSVLLIMPPSNDDSEGGGGGGGGSRNLKNKNKNKNKITRKAKKTRGKYNKKYTKHNHKHNHKHKHKHMRQRKTKKNYK
jgi:hypothetical protein